MSLGTLRNCWFRLAVGNGGDIALEYRHFHGVSGVRATATACWSKRPRINSYWSIRRTGSTEIRSSKDSNRKSMRILYGIRTNSQIVCCPQVTTNWPISVGTKCWFYLWPFDPQNFGISCWNLWNLPKKHPPLIVWFKNQPNYRYYIDHKLGKKNISSWTKTWEKKLKNIGQTPKSYNIVGYS